MGAFTSILGKIPYNKFKNPSFRFRFNLALTDRTPQGAYEEETNEKTRN
jgi:hypothetical protein